MEEDSNNNSMEIPDDIISQHILPHLSIKPLNQCKLISKQWNLNINLLLNQIKQSIFTEPFTPIESLFIQSGKSFYLYSCNNHDDDDEVDVQYTRCSEYNLVEFNVDFNVGEGGKIGLVGCSNGLVCLGEIGGTYFILWNPATSQYHRYYPQIMDKNSTEICWGFGYVSSLYDYKVVRISQFRYRDEISSVDVFSLRTNAWNRIEFGLGECRLLGRPRLVNETLYWKKENDTGDDVGDVQIVSFSLALETFAMYPYLAIRAPMNAILCVMGGCLSLCFLNSDNGLEMHIVKRPGRVVLAVYSGLERTNVDELIGFTKAGKVFIVYPSCWVPCLVVSSSKKSFVTFETDGSRGSTYMERYVPSQISPLPPVELPNALGQVA